MSDDEEHGMTSVPVSGNDNATSSDSKKFSFKIGAKDISIGENQLPYFGILGFSIILLIASINYFGWYKAYGISVAVVSMIVAITAIVLSITMVDDWDKFGIYVSYFMVLWNAVGVLILTFKGPFLFTSNGYFAIWAMFAHSTLPAKFSAGAMQEKFKKSGGLLGLELSATVLMIAVFFRNIYTWREIYALVIALLTEIVASVFIIMSMRGTGGDQFKFPFMVVFAVLWTIGVIVLTFGVAPFAVTGNGFFAAWGGCICSIYCMFV